MVRAQSDAQRDLLPLLLPNSIWRKSKAVVQNPAPGRALRGAARHGTVRYGIQHPPPPSRLYFLTGVTCGAYFYGLYYFAFLECALPGVNQRPQFGQCVGQECGGQTTSLAIVVLFII
jgi:hypothetical protein